MASEPVSNPTKAPAPPWFAQLGLSGKLLIIGGVAGTIAAFLPLISVSIAMQAPGGTDPFGMLGGKGGVNFGGVTVSKTAMVVEDWRGKIGLAGYLATLVLVFVLYPPNRLQQKALGWAPVGVGLLVGVLSIWLLALALDTGSADILGMGFIKPKTGAGAFLNVVAGVVVAAGGLLKAREEKLI